MTGISWVICVAKWLDHGPKDPDSNSACCFTGRMLSSPWETIGLGVNIKHLTFTNSITGPCFIPAQSPPLTHLPPGFAGNLIVSSDASSNHTLCPRAKWKMRSMSSCFIHQWSKQTAVIILIKSDKWLTGSPPPSRSMAMSPPWRKSQSVNRTTSLRHPAPQNCHQSKAHLSEGFPLCSLPHSLKHLEW